MNKTRGQKTHATVPLSNCKLPLGKWKSFNDVRVLFKNVLLKCVTKILLDLYRIKGTVSQDF
jgi:hypothetical protein